MPNIDYSLDIYDGIWSNEQASHLLRRTMFAYDQDTINQTIALGLDNAVDQLLADINLPAPPLNPGTIDLVVPIGQTWVDKLYFITNADYRLKSMASWTVEQMTKKTLSIREKMVLFWHNHFPIESIIDPHYLYIYSNTLRTHAIGNFKDLTKAITVDPSMLIYLNGNENSVGAPNENYARELLELFTVGKGPLIGPGDYTNYTEEDIKQIARSLTGWLAAGYLGLNLGTPQAIFWAPNHDTGSKQLSSKFNNTLIENDGKNEYLNLIDIIFQNRAAAEFICRKLYRWFVHYKIDADVESNIIQPLADLLIANNYEIKPVLNKLLKSKHFYDVNMIGCLIKNPFEFFIPLFTALKVELPTVLLNKYELNEKIYSAAALMEMSYFSIPQVAGWRAYYQAPHYNRIWINNITLAVRSFSIDIAIYVGLAGGTEVIKIDLLKFVATLNNPSDPNDLIDEIAVLLLSQPLTVSQKVDLKNALIPGLPDFEWTTEYSNLLNNPDNVFIQLSVNAKLSNFMRRFFNMPEFNLF